MRVRIIPTQSLLLKKARVRAYPLLRKKEQLEPRQELQEMW